MKTKRPREKRQLPLSPFSYRCSEAFKLAVLNNPSLRLLTFLDIILVFGSAQSKWIWNPNSCVVPRILVMEFVYLGQEVWERKSHEHQQHLSLRSLCVLLYLWTEAPFIWHSGMKKKRGCWACVKASHSVYKVLRRICLRGQRGLHEYFWSRTKLEQRPFKWIKWKYSNCAGNEFLYTRPFLLIMPLFIFHFKHFYWEMSFR